MMVPAEDAVHRMVYHGREWAFSLPVSQSGGNE